MNYSPNDLQSYLWENPRQNMGKSTSKYMENIYLSHIIL